ncbi:hypothetical protein [Aurantiacibacter aquimixticola]|nr:hypothetical protein [Aurantiacibacter aquimixticola]
MPLIAAALLTSASLAAPAAAQETEERPLAGLTEAMEDPATQEQVSHTVAALVGALMEMPVGPLVEAMGEMTGEPGPDIDPDARIRDLMGAEAADAPEIVAERLPAMMGAMAQMAGAFEAVLPQLREAAESLPRDLPAQE